MRISDWSSDVCSSDLRVGNRIALDRCTEPRLPENLSGARIDSFEVAIGIPDKHEPTCGGERRRGEGNPLLIAPGLLHRANVIRAQLREVSIRPRHLDMFRWVTEFRKISASSSATDLKFNGHTADRAPHLQQWDYES